MSGFATYSTDPDANTNIRGVNVAENCAAGNMNNVARALAAEGKELSDTVAAINISGKMNVSGGAFTGPISQSGSGGYAYWAASSLTGGAMYVQPSATALPSSPAEGTIVFQY